MYLQGHNSGQPPRRSRGRNYLCKLAWHACRSGFGAPRSKYLRATGVSPYPGAALDTFRTEWRSACRNAVSGRADHAGRRYRHLCNRTIPRPLQDRGRSGEAERADGRLRQLAHRYASGAAVVTPPTIALTIGDPNGIGPEIAVKAAAKLAREGGAAAVLIGDEVVVRFYAEGCANDLMLEKLDGSDPRGGALQFLGVDALPREDFRPGTAVAAGGRATVDYVAAAMRFVAGGHATAIVACPHSQTNLNAAGIPFSRYPSLLARLIEVP